MFEIDAHSAAPASLHGVVKLTAFDVVMPAVVDVAVMLVDSTKEAVVGTAVLPKEGPIAAVQFLDQRAGPTARLMAEIVVISIMPCSQGPET